MLIISLELEKEKAEKEKTSQIAAIENGNEKENEEDLKKKTEGIDKNCSSNSDISYDIFVLNLFSERAAFVLLKKQRMGLYPCPKDTLGRTIFWYYSWPIRVLLFCTMPNPKTAKGKLYVVTFLICIIWIGVITYLIFFMLIIICKFKFINFYE